MSSSNALVRCIALPSLNEDTDVMNITVKNMNPGSYLVRVQVDGVASPLI
ncbi:hypothetical protein [Nodularia spumigena]|nr:hypothetical protein [Nodularia spumigena]